MNEETKRFINSIKEKIKKYEMEITYEDAIAHAEEQITLTQYNTGITEMVDIGIERFLCKTSVIYFIENYCWISFPGVGDLPFQLYYFQKNILEDITKFRTFIFEKTRQCLTENNFVMTNRGYISIKDVKKGDRIETIVDDKVVFVDVIDSFYTGKREVCHILTNSGLAIDCTLDHKIFTKRGWVKAEDLTLSDEIVSTVNKGKFGDFELKDDKLAAFIGYYMADGKSGAPVFVNTNINYINEMLEAGKLFENCDPYIYKRKEKKKRKKAYDVRFVSNTKNSHFKRSVKEFMNEFGLDVLSENRCLTNNLMNLNEKQMSILLNRLYAGDGWITYKKDNRRLNYIQYEIGLGSPSYKFIKQIEYILQTKYGIHCYIMECFDKRNKNRKRFWKLRINQKKSVLRFINKIGIKGKTDTKKITNLISKETPYKTNQSFEKIRKIIYKEDIYDVYDITTESSNFLTNGLLVHNCGLSTLASLYCLWKANFNESESIDVISLKQAKAQSFVSKMDPTLKRLPEFLKTPIKAKNQQRISWENGSEITSESQSENAGRSDSLSLLVLDEAAHYKTERMVRGIVGAAGPTLSRTGGQLLVISTPNGTAGPGSYYHEQVQQAKMGLAKNTKLVTVDWWEVPDVIGIPGEKKGYNEELKKFVEQGYYRRPKVKAKANEFFRPIAENEWRENAWLKEQHDKLQDVLYKQEILHSFVVSGNSVFGDEILDRIMNKIQEPIEKDKIGKHAFENFWIWKKPTPEHRYLVSCDVSTGTGNDYGSIQVFDVGEYEQAAEYKGMMSTKMFGRFVKIVANYYNEAFIAIECNSIGEAIFNEVYYHDTEPYSNVFKQKKTKNNITRMTGWITDSKTRKLMTNELIDWFVVDSLWNELKIYSKRLYLEMVTWIWDGNKPVHAENNHDDLIIAMGLAIYLRNKAVDSGESFLINPDGNIVEYDSKDKVEEVSEEYDLYGITGDDVAGEGGGEEGNFFQENYGVEKADYEWIVGSK